MNEPSCYITPVFLCEDQTKGTDFLKRCIHHFKAGVPVWRGRGVDSLPSLTGLARKQYHEAKVVYVVDGDKLDRPPGGVLWSRRSRRSAGMES